MACNPSGIIEGATPVIEMTFRDPDDVLTDPLTITAIHRLPDGSEVTYTQASSEVAAVSVGVWTLTLPAVPPGNHYVYVSATGSSTITTGSARFKVKADGVATV